MSTTIRPVLEVSSKPVVETTTAASLLHHFQAGDEQGAPLGQRLFYPAHLQLGDQALDLLPALPLLLHHPTTTTCTSLPPTPMAMGLTIAPKGLTTVPKVLITNPQALSTDLQAQTTEQVDPATGPHPHTLPHQT